MNTVIFRSAFTKCPSVHPNHCRVPKIGVDPVKTGSICYRHVHLVTPRCSRVNVGYDEGRESYVKRTKWKGHITFNQLTHRLTDLNLLIFSWVHVSLRPNNLLSSSHGALSPNFRVVSEDWKNGCECVRIDGWWKRNSTRFCLYSPIITNDHANFHTLGSFGDKSSKVPRRPPFDRRPGQKLAILLNYLAFVVDKH